jgi:uncharacterized heparinase superfamily protein
MMRASIAERAKLSVLVGRRAFRSLAGRVNAHPLLRWRFTAAMTDRLVAAPQDLRTADATPASEIYGGRFAFAGKVVICDRRSPFEMTPPSDEWAAESLGFGWLRHLRAADTAITRANARSLIDDWINVQGGFHAIGWRSDILARRILSWLTQSPFLLRDADARFHRRFVRSLTRQVRYLRRTVKETRDGLPRLQALIAIATASLCLQGQAGSLGSNMARLGEELSRQVLPDGGHISRNPGALIELLLDLIPLQQLFATRQMPPPASLMGAIERMMPMLRFFRLGDGNFPQFNGMGPTPADSLATVLAFDETRGTPLSNAPHSGYQRLETAKAAIIIDTGGPPPLAVSQEAHAGCLSFEFCARQHRMIVNCGLPSVNQENWRQVARATAAHSTVALNDTSSCHFLDPGAFRRLLSGSPIVNGPRTVSVTRENTGDGIVLRASHDGYLREFGIIHHRLLRLAADGRSVDGEDGFTSATGGPLPERTREEFAIRFHLHPSVKANRLADRHDVLLLLPDKEVWTFSAFNERVEIEESVFLAGPDGPRRTVQIVIYGQARNKPSVQWTLRHTPHAAQAGRKGRPEEPELPL